MSKTNGFDLAGFRKPAIEVEYLPHDFIKPGEGINLKLNLDILTLEKMEQMDARFNSVFNNAEEDERAANALAVASTKGKTALAKMPPKRELFLAEKAMLKIRAVMLAGEPGDDNPANRMIESWDLVIDGELVPVSFAAISAISSPALEKLYHFVVGAANTPTKQDKKKSATTSTSRRRI